MKKSFQITIEKFENNYEYVELCGTISINSSSYKLSDNNIHLSVKFTVKTILFRICRRCVAPVIIVLLCSIYNNIFLFPIHFRCNLRSC